MFFVFFFKDFSFYSDPNPLPYLCTNFSVYIWGTQIFNLVSNSGEI